jgi:hypothetical protein
MLVLIELQVVSLRCCVRSRRLISRIGAVNRGVNTHPFLHVRSSRDGLEDAFGSSATTGGLLPRCRYVFPPESHFVSIFGVKYPCQAKIFR